MWRIALAALFFSACQPEDDHPPPALGCPPEEDCSTPPPMTGGGSGSGGSGGSAGSAGTAGSAVLEGNLVEFLDDDFRDGVPFSDPATVEAEGASGGVVSASWTGSSPFELASFRVSEPIWVSARPLNTLALLRTVNAVEPGTDLATLGLVRADTLDFILQLLTVPAERTPGAGHVVVRVTPSPGALEGVAGVTLALPDAESIAYAVQGTWSDAETGTDSTGLIVLTNISAPAFPGRTRTATLGGAVRGSVGVRIAADAVTVLEIPATDFSP